MLIGFEHAGVSVQNMDRSLSFYVDLLGMKLIVRRDSGNGGEVAFLSAGNAMIEMFANPSVARGATDVAPDQAGVRHLTFEFDSVPETYAMLEAAGVDMMEAPRPAHNKDIVKTVAFCRDPDGIIIELFEK